ncbi:integrase [Gossypium australe]|uniref:Integrase n=1 Tax=Gossypium australe TaxID=47621 RepID=A0A5B6VX21_9ROSI|nr:integrase [Gossypium australe]
MRALTLERDGSIFVEVIVKPIFLSKIQELQKTDPDLLSRLELVKKMLDEAHNSVYLIHPRNTKMYNDMKQCYWLPCMKHKRMKFVSKCSVCQQMKAKRQVPLNLL